MFSTPVILRWIQRQMKSPRWFETLLVLHVECCRVLTRKGDFICDLKLFLGLLFPITSFPIILQNVASCPSYKDKIRWCSFSAVEVTARRIDGRRKDWFNCIVS